MEKNKKKGELQSRRQFFKKAAKGALPILGAIALSQAPFFSQAHESQNEMGCYYGCSGDCSGSCKGGCMGCTGTCTGGCEGKCASSCYWECVNTCEAKCVNTCKATCEGSCMLLLGNHYH